MQRETEEALLGIAFLVFFGAFAMSFAVLSAEAVFGEGGGLNAAIVFIMVTVVVFILIVFAFVVMLAVDGIIWLVRRLRGEVARKR